MWLCNQNNLDFVKSWINSYTIFLRGQFDTHILWYCKYFLRTGLETVENRINAVLDADHDTVTNIFDACFQCCNLDSVNTYSFASCKFI